MTKIKVAAVNYLNTKPLLYGIKTDPFAQTIELTEAYPAQVAKMLLDGSVDVGLIPVAVIPKLSESHIITNYCIGCDGAVASVCIFSDVPMQAVETLYLDYQSRTSVQLAKILLKEYWKKEVVIVDSNGEDFRGAIKNTTAGVVIGDRAFQQRTQSKYCYDLGEAWKAYTSLPFVFAAWVSNKKLPTHFIEAFDKANAVGLNRIPQVVAQNPYSLFDLEAYYSQYISYQLDDLKREGLKLFLDKLG